MFSLNIKFSQMPFTISSFLFLRHTLKDNRPQAQILTVPNRCVSDTIQPPSFLIENMEKYGIFKIKSSNIGNYSVGLIFKIKALEQYKNLNRIL